MAAKITDFPANVTREALEILKAYKRVSIVRQNGRYSANSSVWLSNGYAKDFKVWEFYAAEQYTPAQRQLNYVQAFHDYPIDYTGKRDYKMIKELDSWDTLFIFDDDGNIVKA